MKMKKLLSLILVLCMLVSVIPVFTISAAESFTEDQQGYRWIDAAKKFGDPNVATIGIKAGVLMLENHKYRISYNTKLTIPEVFAERLSTILDGTTIAKETLQKLRFTTTLKNELTGLLDDPDKSDPANMVSDVDRFDFTSCKIDGTDVFIPANDDEPVITAAGEWQFVYKLNSNVFNRFKNATAEERKAALLGTMQMDSEEIVRWSNTLYDYSEIFTTATLTCTMSDGSALPSLRSDVGTITILGYGEHTAILPDSVYKSPEVTGADVLFKCSTNSGTHEPFMVGRPDDNASLPYDRSFYPGQSVKRTEFAQILFNCLKDGYKMDLTSVEPTFADIGKEHWAFEAVETITRVMYNEAPVGILNGAYVDPSGNKYFISQAQDGEFLTRGDMAKILVRCTKNVGKTVDLTGISQKFTDVPADGDTELYNAVMTGVVNGWFNGFPEGEFMPDHLVTREQIAKVMSIFLGRRADKQEVDSWYIQGGRKSGFWDLDKSSESKDETYWALYWILEATWRHDYEFVNGLEDWSNVATAFTTVVP